MEILSKNDDRFYACYVDDVGFEATRVYIVKDLITVEGADSDIDPGILLINTFKIIKSKLESATIQVECLEAERDDLRKIIGHLKETIQHSQKTIASQRLHIEALEQRLRLRDDRPARE